jgi:hypothetical protein
VQTAYAASTCPLFLFFSTAGSGSEIQSIVPNSEEPPGTYYSGGDPAWSYYGEVEHTSTGRGFCYKDICANGVGTATTKGEEDYAGTFVHGQLQGAGTYENDIFDYVGGFKDGQFDGHGAVATSRPAA